MNERAIGEWMRGGGGLRFGDVNDGKPAQHCTSNIGLKHTTCCAARSGTVVQRKTLARKVADVIPNVLNMARSCQRHAQVSPPKSADELVGCLSCSRAPYWRVRVPTGLPLLMGLSSRATREKKKHGKQDPPAHPFWMCSAISDGGLHVCRLAGPVWAPRVLFSLFAASTCVEIA